MEYKSEKHGTFFGDHELRERLGSAWMENFIELNPMFFQTVAEKLEGETDMILRLWFFLKSPESFDIDMVLNKDFYLCLRFISRRSLFSETIATPCLIIIFLCLKVNPGHCSLFFQPSPES